MGFNSLLINCNKYKNYEIRNGSNDHFNFSQRIMFTGQCFIAASIAACSSSSTTTENQPFFSIPPIKVLLPSFLEILHLYLSASTQALQPMHLKRCWMILIIIQPALICIIYRKDGSFHSQEK